MSAGPLLTFDDGPDPVWTPAVLEALGDRPAAFFVLADRVAAHPELVEACLRAGHAVELHAVRHVRHTELSAEVLEAEARDGTQVLRDAGATPTRWRPPWGVCAPLTWTTAHRHGLAVTGWTHDSEDWRGESAGALRARWAGAGPGDVVLLHDGLGPGALRDGCAATVEAVAGP